MAAAGLVGVSLLALVLYLVLGRWTASRESTSLALLLSMVTLVAAGMVFAVASLRAPDLAWRAIVGLEQPDFDSRGDGRVGRGESGRPRRDRRGTRLEPADVAWQQALVAAGRRDATG